MKAILLFLIVLTIANNHCFATLKLTSPNGHEYFVAGSDTLITWEGIFKTDTVKLEYSLDNGINWRLITDTAIGLKYVWKNIPKPVSNSCLIKITQVGPTNYQPIIEWQKSFGGSNDDFANSVKQTIDGGYIVAGQTYSNDGDIVNSKGSWDGLIIKLDTSGNVEWKKNFGGSRWDALKSIQQTFNGGYIAAGFSYSKDGDLNKNLGGSDFWVVKLDEFGNIEWQNNFGGVNDDGANSIQQTKDSGYIVAGASLKKKLGGDGSEWVSDCLIIKLDKSGTIEWQKIAGGSLWDWAWDIRQTKDLGYIVAGCSSSKDGDAKINKGKEDVWIFKLDSIGNFEWQKTFGGDKMDNANSIRQTADGGYVVYGWTESINGDVNNNKGLIDHWVIKVNNIGSLEWQRTYGGSDYESDLNNGSAYQTFSPFERASSIRQTFDGGYIFCGATFSSDGDVHKSKGLGDAWVVKIDKYGQINWERPYGGSSLDFASSIEQTLDSGYIIAGDSFSNDGDLTNNNGQSDCWIIKLKMEKIPFLDDISDAVFSIVEPQPASKSVDMGKVFVGEWRDSTVADFVYNIGDYKYSVDSIYIKGADKTAFSLIGGFPKYNVEPDSGKQASFKFTPSRIGLHKAEIVIITQTDTLVQNIVGEGLKKGILISAELKPFSNLICETSTSTTIEIKSTGGDTLRIKAINITGVNKADFSINEALPINLAPDSSKTITIGFKTNVPGIKTAALEIKSNADPESVISIPLTGRKDSVALVPSPTLIDLGTLFPNQRKDTSNIVSNLGTIQTDGKVTFTNNLTCANPTFAIDSGGLYKLDFTFTGLSADGNINEKITVWDEVCKYSREILITGKVVSPQLQGFSAIQCISYSNEYKLTLNNNTSNRLKITSIAIENNPALFEIDQSLVFPIAIDPFASNYEIKVKYQDNIAQKFKTVVNCFTDNQYLPVLTDTIYAETVDYKRSTDGLINDTIRTASNPFAVSYDSASLNGKNKFVYSIKVNESVNDMDYLTELSDLEVIINYNRNVLGADFDSQSGSVKVRLSDDIKDYYSIKSAKETKIDELNAQIIVNLENTGKPIITKNSYKLLEIDFTAYLGKEGLSNEQNSDKSRSAIISHSINSSDKCISYETANNAEVTIEKLCVDEIRSIKITENPSDHFYLSDVIPQPLGSMDATVEYGLGFECQVTLTIYDISGAVVLTPVNEIQKAGTHKQAISRKSLSAGAYFIEMKAGQFKETKKIIVE